MTLSQAIVYYVFAFVLTLAFIICGCFIGAGLRRRKDAKSGNAGSDNVSLDNVDTETSKN